MISVLPGIITFLTRVTCVGDFIRDSNSKVGSFSLPNSGVSDAISYMLFGISDVTNGWGGIRLSNASNALGRSISPLLIPPHVRLNYLHNREKCVRSLYMKNTELA